MTETEREKKNHGGKRTENRKKRKGPKHEEHPPFRWISCGGDLYYKSREILRFWKPNLPTRRGLSHVAYNLIWWTVLRFQDD